MAEEDEVRYSFNPKELNNWKGRITESLTRSYIRDILSPKLEKEGWDKVLFLQDIHLRIPARPSEELHPYKQRFYRDKFMNMKTNLLSEGVYPTQEFLDKCGKVNDILKHLSDGFLLKLKKTGEMKQMKDLVSDVGIGEWRWKWGNRFEETDEISFSTRGMDETTEIPVVTGEIEIVEVKSDKGRLSKIQKEEYINLMKNGYSLRLFHTKIISFSRNEFEVKEKVIESENEIWT